MSLDPHTVRGTGVQIHEISAENAREKTGKRGTLGEAFHGDLPAPPIPGAARFHGRPMVVSGLRLRADRRPTYLRRPS